MPHTIVGLPTVNARTGGGADVGRDRWTRSLHVTFFETVDPELMIVHPMGILITYVRGDRALIDKQLAIEDERAIFPGGARAVLRYRPANLPVPEVRATRNPALFCVQVTDRGRRANGDVRVRGRRPVHR